MRRSSKASQLISQSGNDDIYKFRCMQYLNFVLDQLVNEGHKFKLYASHIESLLRSNLNDITIQDIEKIKRMLQEGERQKVQTQETGEFINYDLIDRKKYTLPQTYYNLQQAPNQALINMYVHNESTLNEVQMIKNQNKIQKLYESNYKMLDLMFQLPHQHLEQQIEKEIQNNIEEIQPEQYEIEPEKMHSMQKEKVEKNHDIPEPQENILKQNQTNLNVQEIALKPVDIQQPNNPKIQQTQNLSIQLPQNQIIQQAIIGKSTPEKDQEKLNQKQKQKEIQPIAEISFVQIKKKKKQRKKPTTEPKQAVIALQPNNPIVQNKVQNKEQKIIQNQEVNQIDDQVKVGTQPPQKRKYIRKKPLEPRKSKPEKQKVQIQDEKPPEIQNKDEELLQLQKAQNNKQLAMKQEQHQPSKIQNPPLSLQQFPKQIQQSQIKQPTLPITKQKKTKKPRKPQTLTKSQHKKSKKPIKQLQIMLPYPECEAQVNQLKKQIQELNIKIQDQKIGFISNQKQALSFLNLVHNIEPEKKENEVQQVNQIPSEILQIPSEIKQIPSEIIEIPSQIIQIPQVNHNIQQQPSHHESIEQKPTEVIQTFIQKQLTKDEGKKQKSGSRQLLPKKQSNKQSSEEYKPAQDELQSISEIEKIENPLDEHFESQNKQKKAKRKYAKRKSNKLPQNNQKIIELNVNKPDSVLTPDQIQQKQKKFRMTQEQRERFRQEKEKLKQMRLKQREEKQKLKELEKLQKGTLKMKKSQTSNKGSKSSSKQRNNSISINESSSYLFMAASEERKQTSPVKKQIRIQGAEKNEYKALQSTKKVDNLKHSLEQSIGNNSTKEDLRLSLEKSLISQELMLIQESEKEVERQIQQLVEFVTINPGCLIEDNGNKIDVFHKEQVENQNGLKRHKPQEEEVEKGIYEQGPKKKIKTTLQPNQTQKDKDRSSAIISSESNKFTSPIQTLEGTQIIQQNFTFQPTDNTNNNSLIKILSKDSQIEKDNLKQKNKNSEQSLEKDK